MKTYQRWIEALESVVPGNSQAAFGGGPGEKGWKQYLACGLSYFLLGFSGPKAEAEAIKATIGTFLHDRLHLTMSTEKTLITHARTEQARFLGYAISTYHADDKLTRRADGAKTRSINGGVRLGLPKGLIHQKTTEV